MNAKFWKEHATLRVILIAVFFVAGLGLTIGGWTMTGQLLGLGVMIVGVACLLAALWLYNKVFQ